MDFRDIVPSEERQLYITAKLELEALERKRKVSDVDYQQMIKEMENEKDPEHKEKLRNWLEGVIPYSEYLRLKEENERWINEIDEKFIQGLDEIGEKVSKPEVNRIRQQLVRLKSYFDRRNQEFLNNRDISLLSDEEVVREYNKFEYEYGRDTLNNMINEDTRIKLDENKKERGSVFKGNDTLSKEDLEKKIKKYNEDIETVTTHLYEVKSSLVLGEIDDLRVVDIIQELDGEVKVLVSDCDELVAAMDEFKLTYSEESLSTNYKEVTGALRKIKDTLRNIKRTQVRQYNIKVEATKMAIEELKSLNDFETNEILMQFPELNVFDENKIRWNTPISSYMSVVDYSKLVEVNRKILEIKNNNKVVSGVPTDINTETLIVQELYNDIIKIEDEIERIVKEVELVISGDDINGLRDRINIEGDNLNAFRAKLENNKDKLIQEEYDELIARYEDSCEYLMDLNNKLNEIQIVPVPVPEFEKNNKVYNDLMNKVKTIDGALNNLDILVHSLFGKTGVTVKEEYLNILHNHYEKDLESLEKLVEEKHDSDPSQLDPNQYNNLKNEITRLWELINNIDEKLRDPGMVKDASVNSVLTEELESLNK